MRKLTHEEIALKRFSVEQLKEQKRNPIYVLLDNVRSLYNVGSIFRTSDGARIEKLFLCGHTPYPPRKEIEKTALGAIKTVPWEYFPNPLTVINQLRSQGIKICSLEQTDMSFCYDKLQLKDFPLCLVLGNEIMGISKDIIEHSDIAIEIPMYGSKQSLNVAVAYGIALFEMLKILNSKSR